LTGPIAGGSVNLGGEYGSPRAVVEVTMRSLVFGCVMVGLVAGCSSTYIPNTNVADTTENRKVIEFCEGYRHAMEEKDSVKLLGMISPRYHGRKVGLVSDDDTDYAALKILLTDRFSQTNGIRYEIKYQDVVFAENNHVYVNYKYSASYRVPTNHGEEWHHKVADNQLDLVPDGQTFKIVAGM
jgi:hypothetical protein